MSPEPELPTTPDVMAVDARMQLQQTRAALAAATGGVAAAQVLAELAQSLAGELAQHFDELPMHRFTGRVARGGGVAGRLLPRRAVPHRVVMGRYLQASVPHHAGNGWQRQRATVAVLALGADGVLRTGVQRLYVTIREGNGARRVPVPWDHEHLARIPSRALRVTRWEGGPEPAAVASPRQVIEVLTSLATLVAADMGRDLALLQRYLAPG